jgi:hypothetical protein
MQGEDEEIAYLLTTTPWGSTPGTIVVKLYEGNDRTDVSATCLSGAASALADVITTPVVKSLTAGLQYRLEIKFTCSGNIFEAYCHINAEY